MTSAGCLKTKLLGSVVWTVFSFTCRNKPRLPKTRNGVSSTFWLLLLKLETGCQWTEEAQGTYSSFFIRGLQINYSTLQEGIFISIHPYMNYRFLAVFGLKCNNCTSETSLEDCENNKTEETCPSGQDRCLTTTAELKLSNVTFKSFIRSCTTKEVCDNLTTFLQTCRPVGGEC